jgi:nitric oxide synthase-interacting protein
MTRHSKNNCSSSYFTSYERSHLPYGTQATRCSPESLRSPATCHVCLAQASSDKPTVICELGHFACKECIIGSMVEQKASIKKKLLEYEEALKKIKERKDALEERSKRQRLEVIERVTQLPNRDIQTDSSKVARAFWRPEQTPQPADMEPEKPDTRVLCHGESKSHPISLKSLIDNKAYFRDNKPSCPSCLKELKLVKTANVLRPCGHILCKDCLEQVGGKCFTCDAIIENSIHIVSEGTGYASAGGNVQVAKYESAFQ